MGSCASTQMPADDAAAAAAAAEAKPRPPSAASAASPRPDPANGATAAAAAATTAAPPPPPPSSTSPPPPPPSDACVGEERPPLAGSVLDTIDRSDHNVLVKMEVETPYGRSIEDVYDGVHDGEELGTGVSGIVRLVTHRTTEIKYAVKKLDLGQVDTEAQLRQLRDEIAVMCQLDHPNVVRLEEVYESPTAIYLIQELCLGGDLFDRLDAQDDAHYTEAKCARLMKQMIDAIRYVHSKGIVHRDLKLENFIFSKAAPDSELRLIDFGLSKHFEHGDAHNEAVGSAYTVAPEVIRGKYDEKCDTWSIGVITYLLLSGETPFGGAGEPIPLTQVRKDILNANYEFEPQYIWENVSPQAVDFIQTLLVTDPALRPNAKEVQQSEWLRVWADAECKEEDKVLNPNVVQALVNFKEQSDIEKMLSEVLSFTLLPEQLEHLRKQFEIMDPEGRGEISLGALKRALVQNAGAGALGSLTEKEVEDIFDAMRVRKSEMRIHWHEFIAAALSQVQVDDRNLDLAFERLDTEDNGYIEVENIMTLMGGFVDEDRMRDMWGDMQGGGGDSPARITKEEFRLLMKGQTQEGICELKPDVPQLPLDSDSGRAVTLPEHTHDDKAIETSIQDDEATPLVVNRMLYRAHRQMRLEMLEASRQFEEEQMKRTAKKLEEKLRAEGPSNSTGGSSLYQAGLIMRHSEDARAPSESVREMVRQAQKEQEARLAKAMKKSGRIFHGRKKSFSDMAAMMSPPTRMSASPPTPPSRRKKSMDDSSPQKLETHAEDA